MHWGAEEEVEAASVSLSGIRKLGAEVGMDGREVVVVSSSTLSVSTSSR